MFPSIHSSLNRTRPARSAFAVTLVALLVLTILGSSDVSAQPVDADASVYAAMFGVTPSEAMRRLKLQSEAAELDAFLEAATPAVFGGLWLQHEPEFKVVVQYAASARDAIARYIPNRLQQFAELRPSTYSLAALRGELSRFVGNWNRPFDVGINVRESVIEVNTISEQSVIAWARSNGVALPSSARVVTVASLPWPAADIYGGLGLDGSGCTSGFSVVNGSGTRGITSAGHCGDANSYQGSDLPFVSGTFGGLYDVQWHTAPAFIVRNWMWDGSSVRDITSRTFWGNQPVGGFVCKFGRNSGYGCGTIARKDDIPSCVPFARPVWVRLGTSGMGGDSGGPVFLGNSAYGTISCADASVVIYSAIDFVEGGVGVTVLTSP